MLKVGSFFKSLVLSDCCVTDVIGMDNYDSAVECWDDDSSDDGEVYTKRLEDIRTEDETIAFEKLVVYSSSFCGKFLPLFDKLMSLELCSCTVTSALWTYLFSPKSKLETLVLYDVFFEDFDCLPGTVVSSVRIFDFGCARFSTSVGFKNFEKFIKKLVNLERVKLQGKQILSADDNIKRCRYDNENGPEYDWNGVITELFSIRTLRDVFFRFSYDFKIQIPSCVEYFEKDNIKYIFFVKSQERPPIAEVEEIEIDFFENQKSQERPPIAGINVSDSVEKIKLDRPLIADINVSDSVEEIELDFFEFQKCFNAIKCKNLNKITISGIQFDKDFLCRNLIGFIFSRFFVNNPNVKCLTLNDATREMFVYCKNLKSVHIDFLRCEILFFDGYGGLCGLDSFSFSNYEDNVYVNYEMWEEFAKFNPMLTTLSMKKLLPRNVLKLFPRLKTINLHYLESENDLSAFFGIKVDLYVEKVNKRIKLNLDNWLMSNKENFISKLIAQ